MERKQRFRPETTEERLDLTSYMTYTDDEGRGSPCPTTLRIRTTHKACYNQPFLNRFWPKVLFLGPAPSAFGQKLRYEPRYTAKYTAVNISGTRVL